MQKQQHLLPKKKKKKTENWGNHLGDLQLNFQIIKARANQIVLSPSPVPKACMEPSEMDFKVYAFPESWHFTSDNTKWECFLFQWHKVFNGA